MSVSAMLANFAVLAIGLATIVGCPAVWANIARRLARGEEVVPFEPRRRATWVVPFAIILAACLTLVLGVTVNKEIQNRWVNVSPAAAEVDVAQEPVEVVKPSAEQIALGGLGAEFVILFVIAVVFLILHVSSGATLTDFGLDFRQAGYDLQIGVLAFVAVSVPTYALQAALHLIAVKMHWEKMESYHPVTAALEDNPSISLVLAMIGLAVFLAPLAEELMFRVLLQGWIEALMAHRAMEDVASAASDRATDSQVILDEQGPAAEDHSSTVADVGPAASDELESLDTFRVAPEIVQPLITRPVSWLPILITAALFALSHLGNGPSAIPLFFFGLALGYVYQQTHRLLPSLVLHMSLNGFTMLIVVASLLSK